MPAAKADTRDPEFENQLYLLIERDFPMLQKDVEEIKEDLKSLKDSHAEDRADAKDTKTQLGLVADDVKALKTSVATMVTIKELPWYKDFQKLLILLFAVGFMILAGVKAYEGLAENLLPKTTITEITEASDGG